MKTTSTLKLLPIGISDYKTLIENNYYYVDKTLLIQDTFKKGQVVLMTRPRRFGKTLNLSMMKFFFERTTESNAHLFFGTKIWQQQDFRDFQGSYPVIFISFKNIKESSWPDMYDKFAFTIYEEFDRHKYLLLNDSLEFYEKELFKSILERKSTKAELENSLLFLAKLLERYHNKKVIVLIDEYDVPIQSAYVNSYYSAAVEFLKSLLTAVLKDSTILEMGIVSGILTLARAGIFTGLNNLDVFNITHSHVSDKFGFTQNEIKDLLSYYGLVHKQTDIEKWYDGYTFGATKRIFNPWSVLKCVQNNGSLEKYWANTSDNILVKRLIARASKSVKTQLESIIRGNSFKQIIEESMTFPELEERPELVWSLLLFTGYVTYSCYEVYQGAKEACLMIPNQEISYLYADLIKQMFTESVVGAQAEELLQALLQGECALFSDLFQNFVLKSMSYFDLQSSEPEKSYHLFVLGLLVMLSDTYEVKSNRESGLGRYDIAIIPKKPHLAAIIIEFKKVLPGEKLYEAAQKALDQIRAKEYAQDLKNKPMKGVIAYGIAFEGKKVAVKMSKE